METELKFQVPPAQRAALRRAVATAAATTTPLRAAYFDTADRRLAAAGLALRLRQEGGHWVQTLEGRSDGVAVRLEHEVALGAGAEPVLDPARHTGSAAGAALERALGAAPWPVLAERFRTDIRRTHRRVRSGGATIEIALDVGHLAAGARRLPVHEIEFELVAGAPQALPALAARWARRFGLWWDARTKAERGERLAAGVERVPATKATRPPVAAGASPWQALAAALQACLAQVLANAAEIAEGRDAPEHLHQLRVGLRRLRTALRDFAAWSGDAAAARALEAAWREPFARLGAARDLDVALASVWPRLQAAGAPALPALARPRGQRGPRAEVQAPAFQQALLDTLALVLAAAPAADADRDLATAAARVLRRAWRRALGEVQRFERLPVAEQHAVRKRLKRLRYGFEFVAALYPRRAVRRLHERIAAAAEALGELNDLAVAETAFDPARDAFALQWLAAEHGRALRTAGKRLRTLAASTPPWR